MLDRDWTGRVYVHVLPGLWIGFGPVAFIERVWWRDRLVYADYAALYEGQRRRGARV